MIAGGRDIVGLRGVDNTVVDAVVESHWVCLSNAYTSMGNAEGMAWVEDTRWIERLLIFLFTFQTDIESWKSRLLSYRAPISFLSPTAPSTPLLPWTLISKSEHKYDNTHIYCRIINFLILFIHCTSLFLSPESYTSIHFTTWTATGAFHPDRHQLWRELWRFLARNGRCGTRNQGYDWT
jgi:hypothetical protein